MLTMSLALIGLSVHSALSCMLPYNHFLADEDQDNLLRLEIRSSANEKQSTMIVANGPELTGSIGLVDVLGRTSFYWRADMDNDVRLHMTVDESGSASFRAFSPDESGPHGEIVWDAGFGKCEKVN